MNTYACVTKQYNMVSAQNAAFWLHFNMMQHKYSMSFYVYVCFVCFYVTFVFTVFSVCVADNSIRNYNNNDNNERNNGRFF